MSDNRQHYHERELRNIGAFLAGFALVALLFRACTTVLA